MASRTLVLMAVGLAVVGARDGPAELVAEELHAVAEAEENVLGVRAVELARILVPAVPRCLTVDQLGHHVVVVGLLRSTISAKWMAQRGSCWE